MCTQCMYIALGFIPWKLCFGISNGSYVATKQAACLAMYAGPQTKIAVYAGFQNKIAPDTPSHW